MNSITTYSAASNLPTIDDDERASFRTVKKEGGLRNRGKSAIAKATSKGKSGLKRIFKSSQAPKNIDEEIAPLSMEERVERRRGKQPAFQATDFSTLQRPLDAPVLAYSEFKIYNKLQKELKTEAGGNKEDLAWKTAFLDLATEQELLENYLNWVEEVRNDDLARDASFMKGLEEALFEDRQDVLLDQAVNRDSHGKTEQDGREIWKRMIKLRRENNENKAGKTTGTVLDKYEQGRMYEQEQGTNTISAGDGGREWFRRVMKTEPPSELARREEMEEERRWVAEKMTEEMRKEESDLQHTFRLLTDAEVGRMTTEEKLEYVERLREVIA